MNDQVLMKNKVIRKKKGYFREPPNFGDYERTRRGFKWDTALRDVEWFPNKKINAAHVAVDSQANSWRKNKIAIYYEGDGGYAKRYTYNDLMLLSNKFANVLKKYGVRKGDRVFIFLPRIPQVPIAFLGILKTGAIAGTLFAAFGQKALEDRLENSGAKFLVTDSELKKRVYAVKDKLPDLKYIILVDGKVGKRGEISYPKEMEGAPPEFKVMPMRPDDPAYMLYTSGTTGKPKGIIHAHIDVAQQKLSSGWVLDLHEDDVYWCTSDYGWVTGIAYTILGPMASGASIVVHGGRFSPDAWYSIIERYKVTVWYTAPTAIRMLMMSGEKLARKHDLSSLRHMCSVGEPLNPEAIKWGLRAFGLPFHDTWWQTETGAMMIVNYPTMPIKLGSMGKPFPGIRAGIVDDKGRLLPPEVEGNLALRPGWPSMMRGVWGNRKRYRNYFVNGWYITGDRALMDRDGYFWFIGRADDVIKTSGERVGPFEVESVLVEHPAIAEAGVIGKPDPLRGEIIKAFVILNPGYRPSPKLKDQIQAFVKKKFAGHAYPREIDFVRSLPKTRSGKIMRRVLKAKEMGLPVGDISTLTESGD
jgi:acetyl-CoA synthetase